MGQDKDVQCTTGEKAQTLIRARKGTQQDESTVFIRVYDDMEQYQTMTKKKAEIVALHFLHNGSVWQAMVAAGFTKEYAKSSKGYSMFARQMVKDAIAEAEAAIDEKTVDLTLADVVVGLKKLAFPAEDNKVSHANQLYALDKLAKIKGGYVDKLEVGRMDELKESSKAVEARYRVMGSFMIQLQLDVNHVVSNALSTVV